MIFEIGFPPRISLRVQKDHQKGGICCIYDFYTKDSCIFISIIDRISFLVVLLIVFIYCIVVVVPFLEKKHIYLLIFVKLK